MKKLVLGSLMAVVVSQAAGCIITSGGGEDAVITANWSLKQQASGQIIPCPPGTTTASIYSQPVNINEPIVGRIEDYKPWNTAFTTFGSPIIDLYDCDDNSGRTAPLPPDVYQVWVQLESENGGTVYARSQSGFVDVIDIDKTFSTTLLNDGGYFQFDWDLRDAANNAPLNCADIPELGGVGAVSTSVANPSMFLDDKFDCEDGTGMTGGLLQGAYTVSVDALDMSDRSISPAPTNLTNRTIGPKNAVTDLGTVMVLVN
jgi:hypothetical protein